MSAIHRVNDIWSMNAPRFFALAWRLPHYQGVLRDRAVAEQDEGEEPASAPPRREAPAQSRRRDPEYREVPAVKAVLQSDPAFAGVFQFG